MNSYEKCTIGMSLLKWLTSVPFLVMFLVTFMVTGKVFRGEDI